MISSHYKLNFNLIKKVVIARTINAKFTCDMFHSKGNLAKLLKFFSVFASRTHSLNLLACKLHKAIFAVFSNISSPNFANFTNVKMLFLVELINFALVVIMPRYRDVCELRVFSTKKGKSIPTSKFEVEKKVLNERMQHFQQLSTL